MNLGELFRATFQSRRDSVALEWKGKAYTFGEIAARSDAMAGLLVSRGFAKGDRLAVHLPNSLALIDLFLGCVKSGVIFVPVNILYREREIAHITRDAEPRAVVTAENAGEWNAMEGRQTCPPGQAGLPILDGSLPVLHAEDPAAIIYTSGTTGTSKGAILTHGNFIANAVTLTEAWQITSSDRFLLTLPLFHIHALGNGLHTWLVSGCRMRLLERFDHTTIAREFLDFEPTLFFGVPTMYVRLLDVPSQLATAIGRKMRLFVSGSAALPAHVFEAFRDRFGHAILERYGMTETFMNLSNPYVGERRPGTVGVPLPGVSVHIEEGELFVRGANVFAGYWRRDESPFTSDGWFPTGDLASVSEDGYYTLLGRKSDVIISGGFNIYPREIEELLLEQPGVREAAVAGIADPLRGEVPVAYIVGEVDVERLEAVCRDQLASFKVPRRFIAVDSLPRTALGKVQKHLLPRSSPESGCDAPR